MHDLAQIQANNAAENVSFITSNLKGYAIKVGTKTTSKDKYYLNVRDLNDDSFVTGKYPDLDNCRLFLRTENAGDLQDYSQMGNEAYVYGTRQAPEVFIKEDPNDPANHEFIAYFNGTHYVIAKDHSRINMKSIVTNEPTKAGFTFIRRLAPMKKGDSVQDSVIIAQKTDTSQNQYGYSLNFDNEGNFYFYVKFDYRQYFVKLNYPIDIYTTGANFFFENFNPQNFKTDVQIGDLTRYSIDVACSFNFATKEAVIELRRHDSVTNLTEFLGRATSVDQIIPNCQLNLPLQEGKWSATEATPLNQVYDISANNFVGTITNPDASGTWQSDNTLKTVIKATEATHIAIANHTNLNNLTEFTVSFWIKFDSLLIDSQFYLLTNKGWNADGGFVIYKNNTDNNLIFVINNGGTQSAATLVDPFTVGQWHFVCAKWKSGEKVKISVDNNTIVEGSTNQTGTLTNTSNIEIHDSVSYNNTIVNYTFFNRQITALEQTTLYTNGAHLAQFPMSKEPQITPSETPAPINVPYSLLYDHPRITVPTLTDYLFLNNPSADNPFVPKYNCADGSPEVIPFEVKYNVPEGTGGTTGEEFTTIYDLAGASSTGNIDDENNEWAYAQYILTGNSTLEDRKITEIQVWLNGLNGPNGGTAYLGIIKENGEWIQFGTGISVSSIPDDWTSYTKQLLTNTYVTQVGNGVGVIWIDSESGDLNIRRGGDGNHYSGEDDGSGNAEDSAQNHYDSDDGWGNPHDRFSMAGKIKIGGGTVGSTPWTTLASDDEEIAVIGEYFGSNSTMKNLAPTKVELKVYKKASTTGTLELHILDSANATKTGGILKTWNIGTDPTITTTAPAAGVLNLVYEDVDNTITIADGEKLVLYARTLNSGGELYVMTNVGNTAGTNNYHSSTSYLRQRLRGFAGFGATWSSHTTLDITGKISVGGQNFTAYKRFSATLTRIYERALTTSSSFKLPDPLTQIKVRGRRVGTIPAPALIGCYIRRQSDNAIQQTIEVKDASVISTTLSDIFFENRAATYLVAVGDYVSIEITGCNDTNYIELNINTNVADATNSVLGVYNNNVAVDLSNYDLAGTFFIGGQVDADSRTRVGQFINTQTSLFVTVPDNSITYMELAMIKVGSPTGTFNVVIRNEDDSAVKTLLSGQAASGLSAVVNSPTIVFVNDTTNRYILRPKDRILVEYDGGDTNNKIGVMVRTSNPNYDFTNSYVTRSNGIEYDYDETKDLVATIKVGGYTYTPDPGSLPPNMPQLSTDLFLGVSGDKEGLYEKSLSDLFLFTTEILTTAQLDNFMKLRVDIEDAEPHELLVTHHTHIHAE